jgi:hypothetical protein
LETRHVSSCRRTGGLVVKREHASAKRNKMEISDSRLAHVARATPVKTNQRSRCVSWVTHSPSSDKNPLKKCVGKARNLRDREWQVVADCQVMADVPRLDNDVCRAHLCPTFASSRANGSPHLSQNWKPSAQLHSKHQRVFQLFALTFQSN